MTRTESKLAVAAAKELMKGNPEGLREIVRTVLQEILEAEMTDALGAAKSERTAARLGYRAGSYGRTLITRVGKLELRGRERRSRPGSRRPLLDRAVRALPALRAGLGRCPGRDVRPGRVDAEGEGDHRGAVRPCLLGLGDLGHQPAP